MNFYLFPLLSLEILDLLRPKLSKKYQQKKKKKKKSVTGSQGFIEHGQILASTSKKWRGRWMGDMLEPACTPLALADHKIIGCVVCGVSGLC